MKNLLKLFFAAVLFLFSVSVQAQDIPNGGFEDWDSLNLQAWETYQVVKDTFQPYQGNNAIVFPLSWSNLKVSWAKTTFANPGHPTYLEAYVKSFIVPLDTVSISVKILNNGSVIDSGIWYGVQSIEDWTKITIPISQTLVDVTHTEIFIQGGHKVEPTDATSSLEVDNLSLHYTPLANKNLALSQNKLDIFPNPTSGVITIRCKGRDLKLQSATLYDWAGRKILESKQPILDLMSLDIPQGVYYLRIITNKGNLTRKVVVETS